jgi:hypothetical protein
MATTTTLTCTLYGLEVFVTIVIIIVDLIWNLFELLFFFSDNQVHGV